MSIHIQMVYCYLCQLDILEDVVLKISPTSPQFNFLSYFVTLVQVCSRHLTTDGLPGRSA